MLMVKKGQNRFFIGKQTHYLLNVTKDKNGADTTAYFYYF